MNRWLRRFILWYMHKVWYPRARAKQIQDLTKLGYDAERAAKQADVNIQRTLDRAARRPSAKKEK